MIIIHKTWLKGLIFILVLLNILVTALITSFTECTFLYFAPTLMMPAIIFLLFCDLQRYKNSTTLLLVDIYKNYNQFIFENAEGKIHAFWAFSNSLNIKVSTIIPMQTFPKVYLVTTLDGVEIEVEIEDNFFQQELLRKITLRLIKLYEVSLKEKDKRYKHILDNHYFGGD